MTTGTSIRISAPGTGPKEPRKSTSQSGASPIGSGISRRLQPTRIRYMPSVATIGCSRTTATSRPLTRPMPAPSSSSSGTAMYGLVPALRDQPHDEDHVDEAEQRPHGEVDAAAAREDRRGRGDGGDHERRGDRERACDLVGGDELGVLDQVADEQDRDEQERGERVRPLEQEAPDGCRGQAPSSPWRPKKPATSASRVSRVALELREHAPLVEDEDAVHQRHVLLHLRREHHDGGAARRQVVEQRVDVGLGARVDAAGRVVEHHDVRLRREPARDHDLLLVAAGERRDAVARRAVADLQQVDVLAEAPAAVALRDDAGRRVACGWSAARSCRGSRAARRCPRSCGRAARRRCRGGRRRAASRWTSWRRRRRAAPGRGRAGRGRRACARSAPARGPRAPRRRRSRPRARRSRWGRWRRAARPRRGAARPCRSRCGRAARAPRPPRAPTSAAAAARGWPRCGRASPTTSPLRRTVLRSAISCSSSMRWEMKTTAVPAAHRRRTSANSRSRVETSSAEVDSSRISTFGSCTSARAITTTWRSLSSSSSTGRSSGSGCAEQRRQHPRRALALDGLRDARARTRRRRRARRCRSTDCGSTTSTSWNTAAMPSARARRGGGDARERAAADAERALVGRQHAGEDLDEGALAAAVLADDGVHLAAPQLDGARGAARASRRTSGRAPRRAGRPRRSPGWSRRCLRPSSSWSGGGGARRARYAPGRRAEARRPERPYRGT